MGVQSNAKSGRNEGGQKFGRGEENITTSYVASKDFGTSGM